MYLNFNLIPGFQNLYLDFINEFDNVKEYYPFNFREVSAYSSAFKLISAKIRPHRTQLAEAIRNQYKDSDVSDITAGYLAKLDSPTTLFVVTGQQLGIFGGPLYTFYKTITAIKLARLMSKNFPEYDFIPLFWLEADDHDFEEVRSVTTVGPEGTAVKISYGEQPEEDFRKLIGKLAFDESISDTLKNFLNTQRATSFTPEIEELLAAAYQPGKTFKQSFSEMFHRLFDKYGLVRFDPQMPEVKEILAPIFRTELEDYRKHAEKLIRISAELDESYHAQVKVKPVNLFVERDGNRYAVEPVDENEFRLKRKKVNYKKEELLKESENNPGMFSPNVILRPICQDFLFPTAFYIGGPGEISYFAQILSLYDDFSIPKPILYPRCSVTLVEKGVQNSLAKLNISPESVMNHHTSLVNSYLEENMNSDLHEQFNLLTRDLNERLDAIKKETGKIETNLEDAVEKAKTRMEQFIAELKRRILEGEKRKNETAVKQINKIIEAILPGGALQEREISFFYFANKYGLNFLDTLFEELEVEAFEHQILFLS